MQTYTTTSNPYQQQSVTTASPAQLVLMLYDRALAAVTRVQAVDDPRGSAHAEMVNTELQRAQDIIVELRATLDHGQGGTVARSLDRLYDFCMDRLIMANLTKDLSDLDAVFSVLRDLRDAWDEACCRGVVAAR